MLSGNNEVYFTTMLLETDLASDKVLNYMERSDCQVTPAIVSVEVILSPFGNDRNLCATALQLSMSMFEENEEISCRWGILR